jgi:hypothetical protein
MSEGTCAACRRSIDAAAKLCPYCGANPATGERIDTQTILQEVFSPREMSTSESVLEYARQRQGVVITVSVIVAFLVLAGIHQFASMRNANAVTDSPAVPLTEIADSPDQQVGKPLPIPDLDFQYDGRPQVMRTYIAEKGAVAPAPPLPAQPAQAQAQTPAPSSTPPSR